MKTYNCKDEPIKVFGVPFFDTQKQFERLPEMVRKESEGLGFRGRACPGARIGFRTDASEFIVKVSLKTLSVDIGMALYSAQSVIAMVGDRQHAKFAGMMCPPDYATKIFEKTFIKNSYMEEVTLWLPRNEILEDIEISLPEGCLVAPPTPYQYGPALYYGSSITEGGCCCNVTNGYNALLSRWLDLDYYNFGFSGSAKGELAVADYINQIDFSLLVLDYDYNAPSPEHLADTHEAFYRRIREKHPTVPVIILSRPSAYFSEEDEIRRKIVARTYQHALSEGDRNVYYVDARTYFSGKDRALCLIDGIHPNDLGFYRMAEAIYPTMKEILSSSN